MYRCFSRHTQMNATRFPTLRLMREYAHLSKLAGPIIEAPLRGGAVGEVCDVRRNWSEKQSVARAQVVGFREDVAVLSLIGHAAGLSREALLVPTGASLTVPIGPAMLGAVVDPSGSIVERLVEPLDGPDKNFKLDGGA